MHDERIYKCKNCGAEICEQAIVKKKILAGWYNDCEMRMTRPYCPVCDKDLIIGNDDVRKDELGRRLKVRFPIFFTAVAYQEIDIPEAVNPGDFDQVRDLINEKFDDVPLPPRSEWEYVGCDGFDWEAPIEVLPYWA